MGCGKTTIGRRLAFRLGYRFIDIDKKIEFEEDRTVSDIFAVEGESYFRSKETGILMRLQNASNAVISTGGGIVSVQDNIPLLKKIGTTI